MVKDSVLRNTVATVLPVARPFLYGTFAEDEIAKQCGGSEVMSNYVQSIAALAEEYSLAEMKCSTVKAAHARLDLAEVDAQLRRAVDSYEGTMKVVFELKLPAPARPFEGGLIDEVVRHIRSREAWMNQQVQDCVESRMWRQIIWLQSSAAPIADNAGGRVGDIKWHSTFPGGDADVMGFAIKWANEVNAELIENGITALRFGGGSHAFRVAGSRGTAHFRPTRSGPTPCT
jgi:hypothetical protein